MYLIDQLITRAQTIYRHKLLITNNRAIGTLFKSVLNLQTFCADMLNHYIIIMVINLIRIIIGCFQPQKKYCKNYRKKI